jgi:hypothetical protein
MTDIDEMMEEVEVEEEEKKKLDPVSEAIVYLYSRLCVIRNQPVSGEQKLASYYQLVFEHLVGRGVERELAHSRAMDAAGLMGGLKAMTRSGSVVEKGMEGPDCAMCDG